MQSRDQKGKTPTIADEGLFLVKAPGLEPGTKGL